MKDRTSYKYYFNGRGYFPVIPLYFITTTKRVRALALIDSGASVSIFRTETAAILGIPIESGTRTILGGVGGKIVGYTHQLHIEVAGNTFRCPIVFSRDYLVSFNLLGREAFFEKFIITFDEKHKRLSLA